MPSTSGSDASSTSPSLAAASPVQKSDFFRARLSQTQSEDQSRKLARHLSRLQEALEEHDDIDINFLATRISSVLRSLVDQWDTEQAGEPGLPDWWRHRVDEVYRSSALNNIDHVIAVLRQYVDQAPADRVYPDMITHLFWECNTTAAGQAAFSTRFDSSAELTPAFSDAFQQTYVGGAHLAFLQLVASAYEKMYLGVVDFDNRPLPKQPDHRSSKPWPENRPGFVPKAYGRIIHVVQSSGTGKSRLVNELIKVVPGISVCLRSATNSDGKSGYPLKDAAITGFLLERRPSMVRRQAAASALIAALLHELATARVSAVPENRFWTEWAVGAYDDPTRAGFFEQVARRAKDYFEELCGLSIVKTLESKDRLDENSLKDAADVFCLHACLGPARDLAERIRSAAMPPEHTHGHGHGHGQGSSRPNTSGDPSFDKKPMRSPAWPEVQEKQSIKFLEQRPTFFLAIDEASLLSRQARETRTKDAEPSICVQLVQLRRALFSLSTKQEDLRLWTVLLDTYSGITELTDATEPSARAITFPVLPPCARFLADVFVEPPPESASIEDLLDLSRLRQYGRPLWGIGTKYDEVVAFAAYKLTMGKVFDPGNLNHVIAVWSNRIWLSLLVQHQQYQDPSRVELGDYDSPDSWGGAAGSERGVRRALEDKIVKLVTEGVRSHMRIFIDLRKSGFVNTTTISEPVLTLGAMSCTNSTPEYHESLETLLVDILERGAALPRGELGEFLCRLTLIMARDEARRGVLLEETRGSLRAPMIKTTEYLQVLLGAGYGLSIAEAKDLERRMDDSVVCFTHFATTDQTEFNELSQETLRDAFCRTVAWQCTQHQSGIDQIIPTYSPSTKLFSYLGVSSKLRVRATTPGYMLRTERGSTPKIKSLKHNCWGPMVEVSAGVRVRPLVVLMDLGVKRDVDANAATLISTFALEESDVEGGAAEAILGAAVAELRKAQGSTAEIAEHAANPSVPRASSEVATPPIRRGTSPLDAGSPLAGGLLRGASPSGERARKASNGQKAHTYVVAGNEGNRSFATLHVKGCVDAYPVLKSHDGISKILKEIIDAHSPGDKGFYINSEYTKLLLEQKGGLYTRVV